MRRLEFGEPLVTQADAARMLGVSRSYVSQLVSQGRIGTVALRGRNRLLLRDVLRLQDERRKRLEDQLSVLDGEG